MKPFINRARWIGLSVAILAFVSSGFAQSLVAELKTMEHDPARRSEKALVLADSAFDNARDFYNKGEVRKGDAQLENMTNALNFCVESLQQAKKAKFYKKAELNVALLQRRLTSLLESIELQDRGWAEQTDRTLEQIHDKLLTGVMKK
jgi:DNA gyrase/topoisomerase IV subunit B